jgi:hypothetical protein
MEISITVRHTDECSYYENGNLCNCEARESLVKLETMPESEFQAFFKSLPARVQMLVSSGMVDWREVLPQWHKKLQNK